jgi:cysteine desulfurase
MREIYLDYAATTPLDPRVKQAMDPYWDIVYGNPSTLYRPGRLAKDALDTARASTARILHCKPDEIIFTAGGTEADNIAIFGATEMFHDRAKHLITTSIEHHAGLRSFEQLEREGWEVTYLPVDAEGILDPEEVQEAIRPDTLIVSVMYANNEIGTIELIAEISEILKHIRKERIAHQNQLPIYFHCDASQAVGFLDLDV